MATVPEVKKAIVKLLGETLPADDVRPVFAYPKDAVEGRKVIVADTSTNYNTGQGCGPLRPCYATT